MVGRRCASRRRSRGRIAFAARRARAGGAAGGGGRPGSRIANSSRPRPPDQRRSWAQEIRAGRDALRCERRDVDLARSNRAILGRRAATRPETLNDPVRSFREPHQRMPATVRGDHLAFEFRGAVCAVPVGAGDGVPCRRPPPEVLVRGEARWTVVFCLGHVEKRRGVGRAAFNRRRSGLSRSARRALALAAGRHLLLLRHLATPFVVAARFRPGWHGRDAVTQCRGLSASDHRRHRRDAAVLGRRAAVNGASRVREADRRHPDACRLVFVDQIGDFGVPGAHFRAIGFPLGAGIGCTLQGTIRCRGERIAHGAEMLLFLRPPCLRRLAARCSRVSDQRRTFGWNGLSVIPLGAPKRAASAEIIPGLIPRSTEPWGSGSSSSLGRIRAWR